MKPTASVFISYRRSDTGGYAALLHDRLKNWFDDEELFFDLETIEPGDDFTKKIQIAVSHAKVVLVLIAPDWLDEVNRRATLPALDSVRIEVEEALSLNRAQGAPKVIPVLLGGGKLFAPLELHEAIKPGLERLLSLDVHHFHGKNADWDHQFVRLRELIAAVPGVPTPRYRARSGVLKPFQINGHFLSRHFHDPRNALGRVRETLLETRNAAIVVPAALYGMGGVGKTQLALKYSYEYRDSYAGVWWFGAETDNTLQLHAREACVEVGAALSDGELPTVTFKRWLARQDQPWLLVFDNAENSDVLRPHLPPSGPHHVIVTSRDPAWDGVARPVELAVWSDAEGTNFLSARIPRARRAELERLSRALGGLQLALEQAAAFLDKTRGSVADYCKQIEGVETAALVLDKGRASTGYEKSVLATLSLAFRRLTPGAQKILRICAFFSAEPIPERYFRGTLATLIDSSSDAVTDLAWEQTIGELRQYGIAERVDVVSLDAMPGALSDDAASSEKALVLHRLTLEVARHALSVPDEDGSHAQRILSEQLPADPDKPEHWPRFSALLPHLGSIERLRAGDWVNPELHARMLNRAARYLQAAKGLYRESERLFRSALQAARSNFGEEHPTTLTLMTNLANVLRAKGDLADARALQEQALSSSRRVLGEEHPNTLTSMNNLAQMLRDEGDVANAHALHEQELRICSRVMGEEHPSTLTSMHNLASSMRSMGDLAGARTLEQQVLSGFRRVLGEEHPDTLTAMLNLAHTLWLQGELASAHELEEQVLLVRRRLLGNEHPDTLASMHNLAFTLWEMRACNDAIVLMAQVVNARALTLGAGHPATKASANTLKAWHAQVS